MDKTKSEIFDRGLQTTDSPTLFKSVPIVNYAVHQFEHSVWCKKGVNTSNKQQFVVLWT